jgi:hypothetical protein
VPVRPPHRGSAAGVPSALPRPYVPLWEEPPVLGPTARLTCGDMKE